MANINWLLIGSGLGITLGEKDPFILIFGVFILSAGFILEYIEERKNKRK